VAGCRAVPAGRTGLTGHGALARATTAMWHCRGPDHGDVALPWLVRAAGAAWRGNREYCGTPGAWGAEPRGQTLSDAALDTVLRAGRGQFPAGPGNHTNGLLRIPGIGSRPYVVRQVSSPVIIGVRTRESSRRQHVGARCLRHGRGYRGTSQD
jgi:hypothetical protein